MRLLASTTVWCYPKAGVALLSSFPLWHFVRWSILVVEDAAHDCRHRPREGVLASDLCVELSKKDARSDRAALASLAVHGPACHLHGIW